MAVITFTFDEDVTGAPPVASSFHIYRFDGRNFNAASAVVSGSDVFARFPASQVANATTCTVDHSAVSDISGRPNPEGATPLQNVTLAAGRTSGPDLLSVGNFRTDVQGRILADYTFDEPVQPTTQASAFRLIATDNSEHSGQEIITTSESSVVTVRFSATQQQLPFSEIARGTVQPGAACDASANCNPLQAAEVNNGGNTVAPDLESARMTSSSTVEYRFDQPVTAGEDAIVANKFCIYTSDAETVCGSSAVRSQTDVRVVTVTFLPGSLSAAVGANVIDGAVMQSENPNVTVRNEDDEVPLQPLAFTAGRTQRPDLVAVSIFTDPVTQQRIVRYTFDQSVAAYTDATGEDDFRLDDFHLYDTQGTRFTPAEVGCTAASPGAPGSGACITRVSGDSSSVDVHGYTNAQADAAVLGTVDDTLSEAGNVNINGVVVRFPEGAANITRL